jgi:hypothetical protein
VGVINKLKKKKKVGGERGDGVNGEKEQSR